MVRFEKAGAPRRCPECDGPVDVFPDGRVVDGSPRNRGRDHSAVCRGRSEPVSGNGSRSEGRTAR